MRAAILTALQFVGPVILLSSTSSAVAQRTFAVSAETHATPGQISLMTSQGLSAAQIDDLERLLTAASGRVRVHFDAKMKVPAFVQADLSIPLEQVTPEEQGYYYLQRFKRLYALQDPRTELIHARTRTNRYGHNDVRYQQYHRGLPVVGAELIVHLQPANRLWFVQGKYVPGIDLSTTPRVDREAILAIVTADFAAKRGPNTRFSVSPPSLGILNPWISDRALEARNVLVWTVPVTETVSGVVWTYRLDAATGEILHALSSSRQVNSETWDLGNTEDTGDDGLWYVDGVLQVPESTPDPDTVLLNTYTTQYYDYLAATFGVYSINSASSAPGMRMVGKAYAADTDSAFWSGSSGVAHFSEGRVNLGTVVHEFTHGLTQHSGGGLDCCNQPGALNESFSDIFAEFVECRTGGPCNWVYGSRNLNNPLAGSYSRQSPDHVGNTGRPETDHPEYWPPCNPSLPEAHPDSCGHGSTGKGGIYHNLGITGILAYHLVNGTHPWDPHYNYQIRGIGLSKAEQLFYGTLVSASLPSSADFWDVRHAMVALCEFFDTNNLHGFTYDDCCQVRTAWTSVGFPHPCADLGRSSTVEGTLSSGQIYHVTKDVEIEAGHMLTVEPGVDVYFFPNVKITAEGSMESDGGNGRIRFLASRGGAGITLDRRFSLRNGGELLMPVHTYRSTDTRPTPIRMSYPRNSYIRIDEDFTITDVNVTLYILQDSESHLRITLTSPSGTRRVLYSGVGGSGGNFIGTVLDDEASTPIGEGTAPFAGSYRPRSPLTIFDGQNARGYWQLEVVDTYSPGSAGELHSWALRFNQ